MIGAPLRVARWDLGVGKSARPAPRSHTGSAPAHAHGATQPEQQPGWSGAPRCRRPIARTGLQSQPWDVCALVQVQGACRAGPWGCGTPREASEGRGATTRTSTCPFFTFLQLQLPVGMPIHAMAGCLAVQACQQGALQPQGHENSPLLRVSAVCRRGRDCGQAGAPAAPRCLAPRHDTPRRVLLQASSWLHHRLVGLLLGLGHGLIGDAQNLGHVLVRAVVSLVQRHEHIPPAAAWKPVGRRGGA